MWRTLIFALGVGVFLAGCNRTSPEDLSLQARQAMDMQNFPMAVETYTRLIADHPRSPEADTAAYMIATIYNNNLREYEKAIAAYREYRQRYPEGPQAPMALFLIGYLYNNELHNLDSAAAVYRSFLTLYPEHEMAPSAKFELDNLGVPPEKLIPQDVTAARTPSGDSVKAPQ
jgi:outer membrane protein assembly factor BamD (BamD/ComL family)